MQNRSSTRTNTGTQSGYVALLRIDKLRAKDTGTQHMLYVENEIGSSNYTFRIQKITSKQGKIWQYLHGMVSEVGLSGGEIAGIVIGCVLGVILIAAMVIMVIRLVIVQ